MREIEVYKRKMTFTEKAVIRAEELLSRLFKRSRK